MLPHGSVVKVPVDRSFDSYIDFLQEGGSLDIEEDRSKIIGQDGEKQKLVNWYSERSKSSSASQDQVVTEPRAAICSASERLVVKKRIRDPNENYVDVRGGVQHFQVEQRLADRRDYGRENDGGDSMKPLERLESETVYYENSVSAAVAQTAMVSRHLAGTQSETQAVAQQAKNMHFEFSESHASAMPKGRPNRTVIASWRKRPPRIQHWCVGL